MGSWSESCGFSGMEIGEGEVAYVCLIQPSRGSLNDGAFHHYAPITTLIRGTYNDYGYLKIDDDQAVLDIFNSQAGLELVQGEDFSLDHLNGNAASRWWMHGLAFDFMRTIVPDFPYQRDPDSDDYKSIKIANIGEGSDLHLLRLHREIEATRRKIEHAKQQSDEKMRALLLELAFGGTLRDSLGYGPTPGLNKKALFDAILNGDDVAPFLTAYQRVAMLGWAMFELRRSLALNESCGPQHGGAEASIQFANFLLAAQAERGRRWGDE